MEAGVARLNRGSGKAGSGPRRCGEYPSRGNSLSEGPSRNVFEEKPRGRGGQIAGERWDSGSAENGNSRERVKEVMDSGFL